MPSTVELRDIYQRAREIVATRWTRGSINGEDESGNTCHCALGALAVAAGAISDSPDWVPTVTVERLLDPSIVAPLIDNLPSEVNADFDSVLTLQFAPIYEFNDADETEQEDVVEAFDRALEALTA